MRALGCVGVGKITQTESTEVFTVTSSSYNLNKGSQDLEAQSKSEVCTTRRHVYWTVGLDLPIFIIVLSLVGLFELGVIPCHKSGFYCNDPALSFPYLGDTVTAGVLMSVLFFLPMLVFFITEFLFSEEDTSRSKLMQTTKNASWLYRAYLYGLMMNLCIVEVMKGIVGGPRPTFFDLCEPDAAKTCNGSEFVATFECTSTKYSWWEQLDSYRSFPSGHTSMSVFCGLFVAWYLQSRAFRWDHRSLLLVPAVQLFCASFAIVSSLTRITDRRHHWWDVLTGTGIGLFTLFYAVTFLCDNFSYATKKRDDQPEDSRRSTRMLQFEEQLNNNGLMT